MIFGHIFGSSKNVPKNIGIHPRVTISHLGIIKVPPKKHKQKKEKSKTSLNLFAVFWTLSDPVLTPIRHCKPLFLIAVAVLFQILQENQTSVQQHTLWNFSISGSGCFFGKGVLMFSQFCVCTCVFSTFRMFEFLKSWNFESLKL